MTSPQTPNDNGPAATQRDELRAKIEASERRIAERTLADEARDAVNTASDYARQNPLQVIGGAVALGVVIGLMSGKGRRAARKAAAGAASAVSDAASGAAGTVSSTASGAAKTVGKSAKKRGTAFGTLVADALVAYGIKLIDEVLDGARTGQDKLEDISDATTAKARSVKRDAQYAAGSVADKSLAAGQRTRRRATRAVRGLADRVGR